MILAYSSPGEEPSRFTVRTPNGDVVFDETLSGHATTRYRVEATGVYVLKMERGDQVRVTLFMQ